MYIDGLQSRPELNGSLAVIGDLHLSGKPLLPPSAVSVVASTALRPPAAEPDEDSEFAFLRTRATNRALTQLFREDSALRYQVHTNPGMGTAPVDHLLVRPQNLFRARPTISEKTLRLLRENGRSALSGNYSAVEFWDHLPEPSLDDCYPHDVRYRASWIFGDCGKDFRKYEHARRVLTGEGVWREDVEEEEMLSIHAHIKPPEDEKIVPVVTPFRRKRSIRIAPWVPGPRSVWSDIPGVFSFDEHIRATFEEVWRNEPDKKDDSDEEAEVVGSFPASPMEEEVLQDVDRELTLLPRMLCELSPAPRWSDEVVVVESE